MDKQQKRLLIIGGVVVFIAISLSLFFLLRKPSDNSGQSNQTANQGSDNTGTSFASLPPDEESRVKRFVKLFADLYNSYGHEDLKSAYNEATYGTPEFQEVTIQKFDALEQSLPEGFSQTTETDESTFRVLEVKGTKLVTSIRGMVTEISQTGETKYPVLISVDFVYQNNNWIVSRCTIEKIN